MRYHRLRIPLIALAAFGVARLAIGQDGVKDPIDLLLEEIHELRVLVDELRMELAQSRLDSAAAQRELDELHQYILDHDAYGDDFGQYRSIKAATERQTRARQAQQARQQRHQERTAKREAAEAQRKERDAQLERLNKYRTKGFTPLGFDVYVGNAAFQYQTFDGVAARVDWNGLTGRFLRLGVPYSRVDFSTMTFSGSVLNATEETRNIGIAVTFFDESGNQVGGEIIQVDNARPNVPYPFTSSIAMALNRPYASSSTYVLYSDPITPQP